MPEMIPSIDILRTGKLMIGQHGDYATLEAAMNADAMLTAGNMDGKRAWIRIIKAVEELQRQGGGRGSGCTSSQKNAGPRHPIAARA